MSGVDKECAGVATSQLAWQGAAGVWQSCFQNAQAVDLSYLEAGLPRRL